MRAPEPVVFELPLPRWRLECGVHVGPSVVRGWWWGPEAERHRFTARAIQGARPGSVVRRAEDQVAAAHRQALDRIAPGAEPLTAPLVLVVHALTADAAVGGPDGWWAPVVGPGRAFDPDRHHVVCFNNLGSCYGSAGPADAGWPVAPDAPPPPNSPQNKGHFALPVDLPAPVSTWDQAQVILWALDQLGVHQVRLATGGSVGGMIVTGLALLDRRFETVAPIATASRSTPWIQGFNHIGRMAILQDPGWPDQVGPGLALARQVAHMTYRAEPGLDQRQGHGGPVPTRLPMQSYLHHQGQKLVERFDARAYLTQLAAMDHHDIERPPPPPQTFQGQELVRDWGMHRWSARCRAIGIDTDQLYPEHHMRQLVERLRQLDVPAEFGQIRSLHGHDGFLIEWDQLEQELKLAMAEGPGT